MRRRIHGQSIVEMALLMPVLVLVLFGIIDLSYYIYGYATVYQAARNGAEEAAQTPPYPNRLNPLDMSDPCVANIMEGLMKGTQILPDFGPNNVRISYPLTNSEGEPLRALGQPIEISITYQIEPLTPLWQFVMFGNDGKMTVTSTSRRSLESLGDNPNFDNQFACSES